MVLAGPRHRGRRPPALTRMRRSPANIAQHAPGSSSHLAARIRYVAPTSRNVAFSGTAASLRRIETPDRCLHPRSRSPSSSMSAARTATAHPADTPSAGSRSSSSSSWPASAPSPPSPRSRCSTRSARGSSPPSEADQLRPPRGDDRLRPDRQDRAGPLRRRQARGRHVRRDPEGPARRDDRGRGQDLLGERRVRPGRDRVGGARLAPGRQPRRLDDHPAARPQHACSTRTSSRTRSGRSSASSRRSSSRSGSPRQFSGEKGKQEIITAYLNQNYYGNQSYGVKAAVRSYFGIDLKDITPAQAAIIAGAPQVALELRPRAQRRGALPDGRRGGRGVPEREARRPRGHHHRRAAQPDPRPARRRAGPRCRGRSTASQDFTAAKHDGRRARQPGDAALDRPALRVGRP